MKPQSKTAAYHPDAAASINGPSIRNHTPPENSALGDHQFMTRGELIFSLRDVHRYWSTPRISSHEMEELENQNLIERSPIGMSAIRLTEQGARVKNWQPIKEPGKHFAAPGIHQKRKSQGE